MACRPYDGKKGRTYFYIVDTALKGAPRKQVQRRGFRTKTRCEQARTDELTERRRGTYVEPSRESTRDYLERWRIAVAHRWRPNTRAKVADTVRVISGELGDVPLGRLDALIIQTAYGRLLKGKANEDASAFNTSASSLTDPQVRVHKPQYTRKPLSPSTMRGHHTTFKGALQQAVRWKLLRENPAEGVSLPAPEDKPIQAWSVQEQTQFLESTHNDRWGPLWAFLLDSGCRMGEALALRWDDLNLSTGYVQIRRTMTRDEHGRRIIGEDTKTRSSRRDIQLSAATIAMLKRHRHTHRTLIFADDLGDPPNQSTLYDHLKRACIEAGVTPLSSHGLRKTMTTLWLEAGVAPSVVAARLGHKNVTMTLNVYTRVSRSWGEQGVETVERYLDAHSVDHPSDRHSTSG